MRISLGGNRGFTFTEVLLIIGLIGIIAGLAIPFYQSFQVASELDNTSQSIIQTLRRAQSKAMASDSLVAFGVHLESQKYVLYKGASYNPADPANETYNVVKVLTINPQLGVEVVFNAVTGETTNTGNITITSSVNKTKIISINNLGVVNVQ